MEKFNLKKFIINLIITFAIGVIPSLIVGSDISGLILPKFYPPKILFPIVWSILFLIMSISITLVKKDKYKIYYIQLIVNSVWTVLFFGLRWFLIGTIWICLLIILVVLMIYDFYKDNKLAAFINIPYLIWLFIALYLNASIYLLNK